MVIKSSSEKKRFTENVINKDTSKALIVRLTGVNTTKLNNWISHVNNSEPFSDDECFQSDGEYDRETKRNAIFEAYLTKNNSQAAAKFNVSNASNVSKWISDLEKCKRCGKEEDK